MSRFLPLVVVVLLVLVLMGRAGRERPEMAPPSAEQVGVGADPSPEGARGGAVVRGMVPAPVDPTVRPSTPELDRMVTLASRQRVLREQRYTYIDSLLASTDSLIRRWEDRGGRAFRVALVDAPELAGWRTTLPTIARRAFAAWQEVYPELAV